MKLEDYMLPCMNKSIFGIDCMGCGTQRALILITKGEFIDAFYTFPAIYTTILFFLALGLNFTHKSRNYHPIIITLAVTNAVIMIVSYFYKQTLIN
jgi:Protein of unknown function (DUF2752)